MKPKHIDQFQLTDDGVIPNNPSLPLLIYRAVFPVEPIPAEPQFVLAALAANRWQGGWINGIFTYHHYHARAHEVLVNLADDVTVQFGGPQGLELVFETGDVAIIPAGVGHCRRSNPRRLVIVGAYPAGATDWDLKRDDPADYRVAKTEIPDVPLPDTDPVTGAVSPLLSYWS
jgi:uncharacterized protein YjlB